MQGYTWRSNQHPPPNYPERVPQYQERPPPRYQERPPPRYQEHFPPKYQDVRNEQSNMFQGQYNTQLYTTSQTRYSNGQQDADFRPNFNGYNAHPQYPCAASNTQQHYPSENPNANGYYAQFDTQSNVSSPQNYRNTGHNQAHMYWSPKSDHGSSVGTDRGWKFHMYNNGSSCSMNNQQQLQPVRTAPRQQQQFSRRHSGKQHNKHHRTQGRRTQSTSRAHNNVSQQIPKNQARSQTAASYTSCNSTTPPSSAQGCTSLPSNNLNQSPVNQNQPELRSNAGPDVSTTQSQSNQSTEQQSQGTNIGTCNVNETLQITQTNEAHPQAHARFANSLIYRLLRTKDNEQAGTQQLDDRFAHHNTCSEVCATNRTDHRSKEPFSEPTAEPPSKRIKCAVVKRDYWNKDRSGVQSVRPGTHQIGCNENRPKGTSQHIIQYSTDPADCLEAVFALQKVSQQVHKAIAIVPPISQQTSNTAQMADTSPKKADSPPLKIDSVWSLEESDAHKTADDKLPESPSPTAQQEEKSLEIETTGNIADSDICSTSPVECQNNVQQGDSDSSDTSFDLSSVPVVKYTLGNLMDSVKSLELMELSSGYPEKSESIEDTILNLYWNGSQVHLVETLISFRKEFSQLPSVEIVRDYESVVFESIETENLKKLAHCDVLNNEMYSPSEEFRSSWLNVDGQPADIEKVLSEPLLDDLTVMEATSQLLSNNTVVTPANFGVNSLKDLPEVSSNEKGVNPNTCSPTALFPPQSGNDREEMDAENNGHLYAGLSRITYLSSVSSEKGTYLSSDPSEKKTYLSSVSSEKEAFKKQEDIKKTHISNTKPSDNSPLAERSTEKLTDCSNKIEVFSQDHSEQTRHNVSVSDLLPLRPEDNVSDGVKNSEVSFSTENLCNYKDTWQIEDISDDENPGNKKALNYSSDIGLVEDISDNKNTGNKEVVPNSSDHWLVEDISDNENTGNKEVLPNSSDIWLVEDISDNENTGNKEVLPNSSDIWQVEDISDDESPSNKDICSNSSDICVVEDVSNDENSSDDTLSMEITVLSSEDAKTFFQELEDEPECSIELTTSNVDCPDLVACFDVPSQPNYDICSLCGTKIKISNSTNVTDNDADLFCTQCWEQAPFLELEEEPCSPMTNEADVLGSPAKSNKQGQDCSPPCVKLEVKESDVTSTKECIADERLTGQRSDHMVKSEQGQNSPSLELKVKELIVASPETCVMDEGLTGQKRDSVVKSQMGENCCSPCVDLKVKEPTVASLKESIGNEKLTGQKCDRMIKSELGQTCSPPFPDLKVKESTVTSTKKCIVDEGLAGQKSKSLLKSELRENWSSPTLELKVKELNVASPETCVVDEGLTGQKRESMGKSQLGQNCSSPSLELKVKVPNVASPEECAENERLTGQKRDSMVKSELGQNCGRPSLELKVKELNVASPETCVVDEGLTGQKRESMGKSQLGQNCSSPSLELKVDEPTVASTKKCIDDEGLKGQKRKSLFKSEPRQYCSPPSLKLQVKVPNVASPEECAENERLTGQKRDSMVKSELGQSCGRPSLELKVNEPTVVSTKKCIEDDGLKGQKRKSLFKSGQNCSSASLQLQVKVPNVASPEECIADEGLTGQISDSMVKSQKVPEIQRPAEQEIQPYKQKNDLTEKNRLAKPQPLLQCNTPCSKKSAYLKHKLKSVSTRNGSDDSVLFTPDIVVKKNLPQKKNLPKKRPSGESQDCRRVKKFKEHRQERHDYPDTTSPHHRENPQKVTEKVPGHSNDTSPSKFELHGILSVNKTKTTEPKKVRFDLYGSNREKQIYAQERRFSAPATLTVSDNCNDYSDVLSAKQKVHHQWSSTFIPKTKSFPPRSPQEGAPQNKKPLKTQDALKSSMSALKSHLAERTKLLSSSERGTNHFRKPGFHQKLTKTLSS